MRIWTVVFHSLLIVTHTASAQDLGDPADLLKLIPSCASKCVSSAFSALKCNNADWPCFCGINGGSYNSSKNAALVALGGKTSECAAIGTPLKPGSCSNQDLRYFRAALLAICEDSAVFGAPNSLVTSAYRLLTYTGIPTGAGVGLSALTGTQTGDLDAILTALTGTSYDGTVVTATGSSAVASGQSSTTLGAVASATAMGSIIPGSSVVGSGTAAAGTGTVRTSTMAAAARDMNTHGAGILYHAGAFVLGLML